MAKADLMIPHIRKWEGGWVDDVDDAGGCTMAGITIGTYRQYFGKNKTCDDLRFITQNEWLYIFKEKYWNRMQADEIHNQSIAQLCVDMCWMSGCATAIKKIQRCLGLKDDGIVGKITLGRLNEGDFKATFTKLWEMRRDWLQQIAKKGNNQKFLKGWMNRLNDCKFQK